MGLKYFDGNTWAMITREERVFCAELFFAIRADPGRFVRVLNLLTGIGLDADAYWEVGYEVCFYRDVLHHRGRVKRGSGFSPKRTFDLCLFSDAAIVIIEAKAHQLFTVEQGETFANDVRSIQELIESRPRVHMVALASSKYFEAFDDSRPSPALGWVNAWITWKQMESEYKEPLFARADSIFGAGVASVSSPCLPLP